MLRYLLIITCFFSSICWALEDPQNVPAKLEITQNIGKQLDLNLPFQDSTGKEVTLGQYFVHGRPVVLVPVYYDCPRLCSLIMDGILNLINKSSLKLGQEFSVLLVSFDPREKPQQALRRLEGLRKRLNSEQGAGALNWEGLVGTPASVNALMEQIGFHYFKDKDEFAHSAMLVITSPEGVLSQYFFGIDFPPWDVKLALIEASQGGVGSLVDHAMLFCFRFDPIKGKYTWAAFNLARAGALTGFFALGLLLFTLWRKETRSSMVRTR